MSFGRAGRTRVLRRLACCLVLLCVLGAAFGLTAHHARAAAQLTIVSNEATSDFPKGMTFSLVAESARPIRHVELLYTTADLKTMNLATPALTPGQRVEIHHTVDFQVNYQPTGIDVTYHWRLTDDQGKAVATDAKTLIWRDDRFAWQSITTSQVTVYAYNGNEAFDRLVLDSAQRTVDRLMPVYGVTRLTPIRIWVYNSKQDFKGTQASNSRDWVAGTAYPDLHLILAVLPQGDTREVGRVVPHEISHQVLFQATRNPFNHPPTWLDEGLAVSNQDSGNEEFPALVQDASDQGHLFSIRALNSDFPYDPSDATLAYAESFGIVRFIEDHFGQDKTAALIAAYRRGVSHDQALRAALGVGIDGLDRLWKESLGYPGDRPRSAGVVAVDRSWLDGLGQALASGVLVTGLLAAAVALVGARVWRRSVRLTDDTLDSERSGAPGR